MEIGRTIINDVKNVCVGWYSKVVHERCIESYIWTQLNNELWAKFEILELDLVSLDFEQHIDDI